MRDWHRLCSAFDEDGFENSWMEIWVDYNDYKPLLEYLESTWLRHKQCFVACWSNRITHFGSVTSGRVESAHAFLKGCIKKSNNDLFTTFNRIDNALNLQMNELEQRELTEITAILQRCASRLYSNCLRKTSKYALVKAQDNYLECCSRTSVCTGTFRSCPQSAQERTI
jgi:hypothetical protein